MIYSAKKFSVICHQNDSVTGKIEDLEAGGLIWSPPRGLNSFSYVCLISAFVVSELHGYSGEVFPVI